MSRQVIIIAAVAMIGSFFLPWVSAFGFGTSLFDIVSQQLPEAWYLLLPAVGGAITLFAALRDENVRLWSLVGALSPILLILILLYQMGLFSDDGGSLGGYNMFDALSNIVGLGAYVALTASVVLIVGFFRLREPA